MRTQKELKDAYVERIVSESWNGSDEWREYFNRKISRVVELSNGDLIALDKQGIKTRFCFGHGAWGDTYDAAVKKSIAARRDGGEYFKDENLRDFDRNANAISNGDYVVYTVPAYHNAPDDTIVRDLGYCTGYDWKILEYRKRGARPISDEDKKLILAAWAEERVKFEKRLDAYLK